MAPVNGHHERRTSAPGTSSLGTATGKSQGCQEVGLGRVRVHEVRRDFEDEATKRGQGRDGKLSGSGTEVNLGARRPPGFDHGALRQGDNRVVARHGAQNGFHVPLGAGLVGGADHGEYLHLPAAPVSAVSSPAEDRCVASERAFGRGPHRVLHQGEFSPVLFNGWR